MFSSVGPSVLFLTRYDGEVSEPLLGRRREQQRMGWLDSFINSMDMNLSKLWEIVEDRGAWCATVHEVSKSWT